MVKKIFFNQQFIRFMFVGGLAAAINFVSRIALNEFFSFRWSVVLAYIIGMLTAYTLSKYLVFEKSGKSAFTELYRFALVNVIAIVQVWLISVGLVEYLFPTVGYTFHADELGHFIGLVVPILTSFIGHKYFTFNRAKSESSPTQDDSSE